MTTNDGRPKRWVIVRPPHAQTGLLLARADGEHQTGVVGEQYAGRVGLFCASPTSRRADRKCSTTASFFVTEPREEAYGPFAVFLDLEGNRWDLLGPRRG